MKYTINIVSTQQSVTITQAEYMQIVEAKKINPNGQFQVKGSFYNLKELLPKADNSSTAFIMKLNPEYTSDISEFETIKYHLLANITSKPFKGAYGHSFANIDEFWAFFMKWQKITLLPQSIKFADWIKTGCGENAIDSQDARDFNLSIKINNIKILYNKYLESKKAIEVASVSSELPF